MSATNDTELEVERAKNALFHAELAAGIFHCVSCFTVVSTMGTICDECRAKLEAKQTPTDPFPSSEAGDAEFFAKKFGDKVRYDHLKERWLVFNGHRWAPQTDGQITRLALESIRARQTAAVGNTAWLKWAASGESRSRLNNALDLAKKIKPIPDDGLSWDLRLDLLGVQNGVVELRTGTLRDGRPDDRITMCAGCDYDPTARCERWETALAQILPHDGLVAYLQRVCGYTLTGDTSQDKWWMSTGTGRNGKGVIYGATRVAMGDYAIEMASKMFDVKGPEWDRAKLPGKRFVISTEAGDTLRLNHDFIKQLTGGGTMRAADKYLSSFEFVLHCKLWLACNAKPKVTDDSYAFWARVTVIPFTVTFEGATLDTGLRPFFENDLGARRAVLAWLVQGAKDFYATGLGEVPAVVTAAVASYKTESEVLAGFYDECCVIEPSAKVQASKLYEAYRLFQLRNHADVKSLTWFGKEIRKRFTPTDTRTVWYLGIGLSADMTLNIDEQVELRP